MPALSRTLKFLRSLFLSARRYYSLHPFIATLLTLIVVGGLYWSYTKVTAAPSQVHYVLGTVATSTIVSSISESGQVASSNTLSITPQVSGQLIAVLVKPGQKVSAGTLIAEVDPTNAQKSLRDAQSSLASAKISLQKLTQPSTALTLAQAQDGVLSAQNSLATTYSSSASDLAGTFLDMPSIMTGLADVDFGTETNRAQQWNLDWYENQAAQYNQVSAQTYRDSAYSAYLAAKASYDKTFADYQQVNIANADATTTGKLLKESYDTLVLVLNATKATNALIQYYSDQLGNQNLSQPAIASTQISALAGYTSKLASHTATLFSDTSTITSGKQNLNEKELSLAQLQQGADTLDIASAQLSVQNQENAVQDAEHTLSEYYIRAPFAGTIGSVSATPYSQAGSGSVIATLITTQQYAQLSVNEVDAAKLQLGQKVTLSFDAIPDLTLTGSIASIDQVGAVSQGVVSYTVKIGFDSQDSRIKPGMTVTANIQTGVAEDVLAVPQSAVKTQNGQSYVLVFSPPISQSEIDAAGAAGIATGQTPEQVPVTTGLSDNTTIAIMSGLTSGEQVVTGTRSGTTLKATTSSTGGGARSFGGGGGGGAALRGL
jgi:RND family efflux transporter MFP subunit